MYKQKRLLAPITYVIQRFFTDGQYWYDFASFHTKKEAKARMRVITGLNLRLVKRTIHEKIYE